MSYTAPEELLEGPISVILDGLEQFERAAKQRMSHLNEWNDEHLDELGELLTEIRPVEMKLRKLYRETR